MFGNAKVKIKNYEISAVITRADGTIEDLGVISRSRGSVFQRLIKFIRKVVK